MRLLSRVNIFVAFISGILLAVSFSSVYSATWIGPTATAPGDNTPEPLNKGSVGQVKTGGLGVTNFVADQICFGADCRAGWSSVASQWTTTGSDIYYNMGKVGIGLGASVPATKLHVLGTNTVGTFESTASYIDLNFKNSLSTAGYLQYNGTTMNIFADSGSTPTLSVTGGSPGSVGVGTQAPSFGAGSGLEIEKAGVATLRLENTSSVTSAEIFADANGLNFKNYNGSRNFTFTTGNVGIGTLSPTYMLDVYGSAWNNTARIYSTGGSSAIDFWDTNGSRRGLVYSDASGFGLLNKDTGWALMIPYGTSNVMIAGTAYANGFALCQSNGMNCPGVTSSQWTTSGSNVYYNTGNVGIGTTNPGQKLSVAGTIESTSGGVKFPDGTTQTTAAGASSPIPAGSQRFTSNGTFTVPAGVTRIMVEVWGAGGGGGGAAWAGTGATGGTSSFGPLISATGGTGGTPGGDSCFPGKAGNAGIGSGGVINIGTGAGSVGSGYTGTGGSGGGPNGGKGNAINWLAGEAGQGYASGGGGQGGAYGGWGGGGGGGGGGYSKNTYAVTPGASYTVTIGAGGAGGVHSGGGGRGSDGLVVVWW